MKWYSSDRITSLMGNGLLTCTRSEADLDELYGEDSMLYYSNTEELIEKLDQSLSDQTWKSTASNGWQISHEKFGAKRVTAQLIDFIIDSSMSIPILLRIMSQKPIKRIAIADAGRTADIVNAVLPFIEDRYDIHITQDKNADYVFHSCFGNEALKYSGIRIFVTGEYITPQLQHQRLCISFRPP